MLIHALCGLAGIVLGVILEHEYSASVANEMAQLRVDLTAELAKIKSLVP